MQRRAPPWILAACLCALAPVLPAHASGGWVVVLKNTPAEDFDDEDIKQFLAAGLKVLNAETPPEELAWNNPESGAGGHVKELARSVDASGRPCRRLRLGVYSKQHAEAFATWTVCRTEDGRWKVAQVHSTARSR